TLSFASLDRAADAWAAHLAGLGLGPGAHVGLLAANTPGWLAAAFGVWRAGATLVPISTFVTARELADTLADGDIDTLIVQPRLHSHDYLARLDEVPPAARPTHILPIDAPVSSPSPAAPGVAIEAESIACILYTSGTTGRAKGVMLSHRAILATMRPTSRRSGLTAEDTLLSTLPLFWVAGLVIRALPTLAAGCALLLLERFTVEAALAALRRARPTALHLRPPQVGQLLAHPGFDPSLLAPVRRGGGRVDWFAPHLDPAVARLTTGYGMTETAGYVTALDWRDPPAVRAAGLGTPLPGVEVRVVDPAGVACLPGQSGEIRVRGPGLFSGYYKQPPGTGLDAEGFFKTGDLGQIDADGTFHFSGRSKDLLRVKGINVSPVEVETVLATHPSIEAVYVVGLPHDGLDQEVVALIVPRDQTAANEAALRRLATETLSHYKRPTHYLTIGRDDVVLGGTAKPQRAALAALATRLMMRTSSN
ncbi:MAG: class I adenylate-forming enzyme family protein, partial [Candidatus Binatia bacterium]